MKTTIQRGTKGSAGVRGNTARQHRKAVERQTVVEPTPASCALSIKSILVPTDFSAASEKALAYAVPMARLFGAKLTLLHVVEPVAMPDFAKSLPIMMDEDKISAQCESHLKRIVSDLGLGPKLVERSVVRFGRAGDEIARSAAAVKADLIIISTHGYTGLKHALLGGTAERVVRYAACPVLIVRPTEHEFIMNRSESRSKALP